ncbi:hypothetical protein ACHAO8_001588 [Botrytis cinerea]
MTGLGDSSTRIGMNIGIGVETPQISLPGLIDKSAGDDLAKWRESNWKEGLNAGGCGVSGSFGLGGVEEGKNGEIGMGTGEDERPKYIIHTHAPKFTDKAYSTPLVKQLLVNCYRGALVEAMGIAESEEKRERDDDMTDREGEGKAEEVKAAVEEMEEESAKNTKGKAIDGNAILLENTREDASMRDTDTDANENILAEREITPEIPRKIGLRSFGTVNVAGSMSCPASLASPRDANLDTSGISPISSPSILPSKSIRPITSIPPILLSSPTSAPSVSHDPSKEHIPQTSPRPTGITIAFPAISTGHKSFPHRLAARIAVGTVRDFLRHPIFGAVRRKMIRKVVFCVWPVDSPNRKALQVAFGLNFPPPLPQSAPLSPVSNQLSTPPFSPSVRGRRGFDFKLGLALRDFEGETSLGDVPKIVVTPPVTPMAGLGLAPGERERERYSSGFESSEGKRLSRGNEYLGDKESESVEDMDMDIEEEEEVEVEADIEKEVDMEAKKEVEKEVDDGVGMNLTRGGGQRIDKVHKEEKLTEKKATRVEIGRCNETEKNEREGEEIEELERYLNKEDTRTPKRLPGTVERKTERSVDGEIEKEEVNPTKVADERVRRPEAGDGTASPKSISSIGERRAKQSKLKDKERQENKTAGNCIRRHGSTKTQNKQERGYTERKEVGDNKAGTKRGRPSKMDGSGTGGSDTERRGGRKKRK